MLSKLKSLRVWAAFVALSAGMSPLCWANDYDSIQRLIRSGQHTQAIAQAQAGIQANPKDPQLRFLLASAQSSLGQADQAIDTLRALSNDYPELAEPHNNLAVLYAAKGDYQLARQSLESAIGLNPQYATAYENLGDVYARLASQQYALSARAGGNPPRLSAKQRELAEVLNTAKPPTAPAEATAPSATPAAGHN